MQISETTADNAPSEGAEFADGKEEAQYSAQETQNAQDSLRETEKDGRESAEESSFQTKAFARRLKEKTGEIEAKYTADTHAFGKIKELLNELEICGEDNDALLSSAGEYVAAQKHLSEQKKASEESAKKTEEYIHHPMTKKALESIQGKMLSDDLASIQKAYPNEEVSDLFSIGDIFMELVSTGKVSAVSAYAAQKAYETMTTKIPPAAIGSIKGSGDAPDKDFYTAEEAKRLSTKDFDKDPRLMDKVRRSMLKWK